MRGIDEEWFKKLLGNFTDGIWTEVEFKQELVKWVRYEIMARFEPVNALDKASARHCNLMAIDHLWKTLLADAESVRSGIHLRAFAQQKPDLAYQKEVFNLFSECWSDIPVATLDFMFMAAKQATQVAKKD